MQRLYRTTWGAQVLDRGVRFRLWAPAARTVSLVVFDAEERIQPMQRREDAWFEIEDGNAGAGTRYLFEIDGALRVADPASRFQPDGPEQPSMVIDPAAFEWPQDFIPRPYHEWVIYELHFGTFTREGTYTSAIDRLDHLAELGVTAVEIMPLSQAPGMRNWGYDGVLHYAPANYYGTPEELKRFVVAAHERGLAVVLDVVYNHFGPQGNYLPHYAPQFFNRHLKTPWGDAIDYSSPGNEPVRRFAIENACYWLVEYAFDGLRLDATPMIIDNRPVHILHELLDEAKRTVARPVYLIAEDVKNEIVERAAVYDGRWSDDTHDALHVMLTHDQSDYYRSFRAAPLKRLVQTLATEETHLVEFLQNHDQVGNRPFGERITALAPKEAIQAALAFVLLAPPVPLLFMGEEWGASAPFLFFCDFEAALARRVTAGRRREFASLAEFADPVARLRIPDPASEETFFKSKLAWEEIDAPEHGEWLEFYRMLLRVRRESVAPHLQSVENAQFDIISDNGVLASWKLAGGKTLTLQANLRASELQGFPQTAPGRMVFATHQAKYAGGIAPAWSVRWSLGE